MSSRRSLVNVLSNIGIDFFQLDFINQKSDHRARNLEPTLMTTYFLYFYEPSIAIWGGRICVSGDRFR